MMLLVVMVFRWMGETLPALSEFGKWPVLLKSASFSGTALAITLTLAFSRSQSFGYLTFCLHPLLAIVLARMIRLEMRPLSKVGWVAIFVLGGSLVASAVLDTNNSDAEAAFFPVDWYWSYLSGFTAGFFFACSNVMTTYLRQNGVTSLAGNLFSSLELNYLGIAFSCFVCVPIAAIDVTKSSSAIELSIGSHTLYLSALVIGCALTSECGGWLNTKAFAATAKVGALSAIDLTVVCFAVIPDIFKGNLTSGRIESLHGLCLLAVGGSAALLAYVES